MDMNQDECWHGLPEDILFLVLRRLPLQSKLLFATVCRSWQSLLLSPRGPYLGYHSCAPPSSCFLLATFGGHACAYDPVLGKWQLIPKPNWPGASIVAAGGGGLICLGNQVSECRVLHTLNPCTGKLRALPPMPRVGLIHKVSIGFTSDGHAYVVMVTGEEIKHNNTIPPSLSKLVTEIFDSLSGTWQLAGEPPSEAKLTLDPGVWCSGTYYCVTEMPLGVLSFELCCGRWRWVEAKLSHGIITSASIVAIAEDVYMVGKVMSSQKALVRIWKLVKQEAAWVEMAEMPETFGFAAGGKGRLVCGGVNEMICISDYQRGSPVLFNSRKGAWTVAPADPLFPSRRDSHLLAFPFHLNRAILP